MKACMRGFTIVLLSALGVLSACSQSRKSIYAGQATEELWAPMSLCQVNLGGYSRMGCFSVQLSLKRNIAYFDVQELLFNPSTVPYRILARPAGSQSFQVLADNLTVSAGGSVEVRARSGQFIENYEEWRVELSKGRSSSGLNLIDAAAGSGIPVAQDYLNWEELTQ